VASGSVIGVVGGLGPAATVFYYESLVGEYRRRGLGSPRVVIYTVPIEEMCRAARAGDVGAVAGLVGEALEVLARAGASVALVAANTPHMAWDAFAPLASRLGLRLIHIAEPAVERLRLLGASRVGILATSGTLRAGFYQERLEGLGMEPVVPDGEGQRALDQAIEALAGASGLRAGFDAGEVVVGVASQLVEAGADAILVACTDISPLLGRLRGALGVPVVDSSVEHVKAAVDAATGGGAR